MHPPDLIHGTVASVLSFLWEVMPSTPEVAARAACCRPSEPILQAVKIKKEEKKVFIVGKTFIT